jgi:hypothetical protein
LGVQIKEEALAVIRRSLELAGADPSEVGVRLRMAGGELRSRFAKGAEPGDETLSVEGIRIFVAPNVLEIGDDVEIGVTDEHDKLVARPRV